MTPPTPICPIASFLILLLLTACGDGVGAEDDSLDAEPWALEEDLRIDDEEDYFIGGTFGMTVSDDGVMYVADNEHHHIKVISSDGQLLETIGEQGQGPGEFIYPQHVRLARGDSLYVVSSQSKLSVFAPETHEFVRSVNIDVERPGNTSTVYVPETEGFLVYFMPRSTEEGASSAVLFHTDEEGGQAEPVNIPQRAPDYVQVQMNGHYAFRPVPFSRLLHYDLGPGDRHYHGISDSLAITISDFDGSRLNHWSLAAPSREVTQADIDYHSEREVDGYQEAISDIDINETHPHFYGLHVDDQGRVWLLREQAMQREAENRWWVINEEGELLAETHLPANAFVAHVSQEYVYGIVAAEDELPAVIRYRIDT